MKVLFMMLMLTVALAAGKKGLFGCLLPSDDEISIRDLFTGYFATYYCLPDTPLKTCMDKLPSCMSHLENVYEIKSEEAYADLKYNFLDCGDELYETVTINSMPAKLADFQAKCATPEQMREDGMETDVMFPLYRCVAGRMVQMRKFLGCINSIDI